VTKLTEKVDKNPDNLEQEVTGPQNLENESESLAVDSQESLSEVEQLQAQAADLNQRLMRIAADFDNFRKRTRTEKEELAKYANSNLVTELLPVLDNFQRALEVQDPNGEVKKFLAGMEMIYKQLLQLLAQTGLEPINAIGETFDPKKHEAVMHIEDESVPDNVILEELRCGYMFKDKVLRPSMVKVAKNEG